MNLSPKIPRCSISISMLTIFLALNACRSHSQDPCLKSINIAKDAGFAKIPGGFVVFSDRQISADGKRLEEVDRLHRITGSFEFSKEDSDRGSLYYVDIVTTPNALYLGQLDRVYLEVYVGGAYLKIPVVANEYEVINKIFKAGQKSNIDPELLRYGLTPFSQAPFALKSQAGKERSVRDFLQTTTMKELCPDGDETCIGLDSLRVYRFQVMLSNFHLARIYRDEIEAGLKAENIEGIGSSVLWSRHFLVQQRELLAGYVNQASQQRADFVKNLNDRYPELSKAYETYRAFQNSLLKSEIMEAKIDYASRQACFAEDGEALQTDLCEDFTEMLPESFPAFRKFSKDVIEKEMGGLPTNKEFLADAKAIAQQGLESYRALIDASRVQGIETQIFSNYVPSKNADGNPEAAGLFYGGLSYSPETPTQVTIKNQNFEFNPFQTLESLALFSNGEAAEPAYATRVKWHLDGADNFRYCFQIGANISLAGLPVLGLHGGCEQSGGAVIIPAPYTPNNDLVASQGASEPADDPDVAVTPKARPDITAARAEDPKDSFHAEDYHSGREGAVAPVAPDSQGSQAAAATSFSDNYRATTSQQVAGCGQ